MKLQTVLIFLLATVSLTGQGIMLAGGAVAEAGGFDANDIPNLEGWYSATDMDGDGVENEETSSLATWIDKSANSRNLTKSGTVVLLQSKINGQNVLEFDGSTSGYYQASTASDWTFLSNGTLTTVFVVFEVGAGTTNTNLLNTIYTTQGFSSIFVGAGFAIDDRSAFGRNDAIFYAVNKGIQNNNVVSDIQNNIISHNAFHLLTVNSDPSNLIAANRSSYKLDGTSIAGANSSLNASSTSAPQLPLTIGSRSTDTALDLEGYIAEIIIYSRDLTTEERTTVEAYLANKYGL